MINKFLEQHGFNTVPASGLLLVIVLGCVLLLCIGASLAVTAPKTTFALFVFFVLLSFYFKRNTPRECSDKTKLIVPHVRKCAYNHAVELVECDMSNVYDNPKCKVMYHLRCVLERDTCEFSEYYYRKADAINGWNKQELL